MPLEPGGSVPPSVHRQREVWDRQARERTLVAILDTPEVRDGDEQAFRRAGEEDARRLASHLPPDARVLDLGCGIGRVLRPIAARCREAIGVDISREMLARAEPFLAGVPNVRTLLTDGCSLRGIDDASIDFVYSLLVLIHVDRRTAFRYFGEIARVLVPGGRALLQFQDITARESVPKLREVVGTDYPLEFYTREELAVLLGAHGLEILTAESAAEYLFLHVVRGRHEVWLDELAASIRVGTPRGHGWLWATHATFAAGGELRVRVELARPVTFSIRASLGPRGRGPDEPTWRKVDATAMLGAGAHEIAFVHAVGARDLAIEIDGARAHDARVESDTGEPAGRATFNAGLLPFGLPWSAETLAIFPQLFAGRDLELA